MEAFQPDDFSRWLSSAWKHHAPQTPITGISKDTRSLRPGDLYVAIRGDQFDGHAFVQDAFGKGAVGALVDDRFEGCNHPLLVVPDTVLGLQDLARGFRSTWQALVVGVTGSVGKTTVKEMCADVLSMKDETHRTSGNYNNHIGLPLTMLAMPKTAGYGVFEIGMNHPGEIEPLSALLKPQIGMLTDICNAHREAFDSLEGIAREKIKLIEQVPEDGTVILDRDSAWYPLMRERVSAQVLTISFEGEADVVGFQVGEDVMRVDGFDYEMPQPGVHMMRNALRAISLGLEVGLEPDAIAAGLKRYHAPPMRWQVSIIRDIVFVNDAYNANPLSMRASLGTFVAREGSGKKWAVIGGMRELGAVADEEHAALGRFLDGLPLDGVVIVGALGRKIVCNKIPSVFQCNEPAEAAMILKENLSAGDRVLLKASRGEQLEKVLERFKEL